MRESRRAASRSMRVSRTAVVHLTAEPAREPDGVEGGHGADGGLAARERLPDRRGAARAGRAHHADTGDHHASWSAHRRKIRLTFCPPNPNELLSAISSGAGRAVIGTQSNGISGSTVDEVGGGRDEPVLQREQRRHRLDAARRRHGVPHQRLGGAHRHAHPRRRRARGRAPRCDRSGGCRCRGR